MKNGVLCFILISAAISTQVFAGGRAETGEDEIKTQNDEWILCITNFDVSSLYAEKTNISGIVTRNMVQRFNAINFRTRISPEYAYYEDRAWAKSRSEAAKALSAKINERSSKIYLGDPEWKYSREIAALDTQIEELRLKLEEVENTAPLINKEPVFKLTDANSGFSFPASPASGEEVKFCKDLGIDAFLSGSITDYHGRYLLSVKLYAIFTRSYVWEDRILFSHDDLTAALEELILRMIIVLSGNKPSAVAVSAQPEDTLVLINRSFAGKGNIAPIEYPAGKVTITASAPDHDSLTFETELMPGELASIDIRLNPVEYGEVEIFENGSDGSGTNIYLGALYVGETPLTLRLPAGKNEYIEAENSAKKGSIVYQTPDDPGFNGSLTLRLSTTPKKGHLDRARRHYYWVWGGTWIAGITAWISYYTYMNMNMALSSDNMNYGNYNKNFYDDYTTTLNVFNGTLAVLGVVTVYGLYRLIKYLSASGKGTVPAAAAGRKK